MINKLKLCLLIIIGTFSFINWSLASTSYDSYSMKKLLTKTDISVSKIYIEKKLTSRLPCQYYADFLKYNKHEIHLFIVNFENLDNLCSKFSIVSHYLAYKAYNLKDNKLAFKYAEMACKSIPSRSCEMATFLALEDDYDTPSYELRMFNAQELLKIGHEQGDIKSASMLHDIYNRPKLFYKYANPDLAKKIFPILEISQDISA